MSDSFADLWNSSAPTKPNEIRTLGALSSASNQNVRKPTNDVFSMLAATSSSSSVNSRSTTPSHIGRSQVLPPGTGAVKPLQKSSSTSVDAFSNLLSPTFASSSKNGTNLTIAQRAAQVEKQRSGQLRNSIQTAEPQLDASTWAGLDALGAKPANIGKPQPNAIEDDWTSTFTTSSKPGNIVSSRPSQVPATTTVDDDWGLHDFGGKVSTSDKVASHTPPKTLLDFDPFSSPLSKSNEPSSDLHPQRSNTPGDFDFGDREDGLLNEQSDGEDDILGDLAKPVETTRRPSKSPSPQPPGAQSRSRSHTPQTMSTGTTTGRAVSPPPHIVGQIVEMGFSPQQARIALAATDTGLDVQAALENLLSNGAGSSTPPITQGLQQSRDRRPPGDSGSDDDVLPRIRSTPRRGARSAQHTPSPVNDPQRNLQEQADKLLAQASEIGLSVFNRANAFWREGKEKVQKAYEERAAATKTTPVQGSSSRPRWMQDDREHEEDGSFQRGEGFRDDDDRDEVLPSRPPSERKPAVDQRPKSQPRQSRQSPAPAQSRMGNLLSDDAPTVYVSPFRRKTPSRSQTQPITPQPPLTKAAPTPPRARSPPQLVQRKTVSASASAISTSLKHKEAGTEMFKLGRYAEAETHYSSAIEALPESHLLLVPLYNNRALTRIKTGDHSGAVEDCTTVVMLIGPSYHPAREAKVTKEDEGSSADLADGLSKALRRRAEAYEGKEKWDAARQDWETIAGAEWAGKLRNEAVRGAGRCRRMLSSNPDGPSSPAQSKPVVPPPRPKPQPKPVQRGPTPPSEALNRVREANAAAEAEDQARHDLKDVIDARLQAWKGGKETNIRALIASLETVLWPELGWQKVGMHELVTPSQVKIRYTKAIAKLHPDKLNTNNTTLEQRMIANGVFGSLSDAWNAFKQ